MKFKYNIIGDNTKKNRDWLLVLGYIPLEFFLYNKYIYTNFSNRANFKEEWKEYYFETHDDIKLSIGEIDYINCIGNDKLFRAISALNNDSDYMQWFTDDEVWKLCLGDKFSRWCYTEECENIDEFLNFSFDTVHKATLEELQDHFKNRSKCML